MSTFFSRFVSVMASLGLGGGCATAQQQAIYAFPAAGSTVTVAQRTPSFQLPTPGGQLFVYASGESKWYPQSVRGTVGTIIIGRIGNDFGILYPVEYRVGSTTYSFSVMKTTD